MTTGYNDLPNDYNPPTDWYQSTEARRILAKAYARKLVTLAMEIDSPEALSELGKHRCREQAGEVIINAFGNGFLRSIPKLDAYIAWHTASDDDDPKVGVEIQARRMRCPANLFLDVVGGHLVNCRLREDGSVEVLGPKHDDGILPAMDSVAFERGNAGEACRFLADVILSEPTTEVVGDPLPGLDCVPLKVPNDRKYYLSDLTRMSGLSDETIRAAVNDALDKPNRTKGTTYTTAEALVVFRHLSNSSTRATQQGAADAIALLKKPQ